MVRVVRVRMSFGTVFICLQQLVSTYPLIFFSPLPTVSVFIIGGAGAGAGAGAGDGGGSVGAISGFCDAVAPAVPSPVDADNA